MRWLVAVARDAVVGGAAVEAGRQGNLAALVGMTGYAPGPKICGRFGDGGLHVGIMTADTAHASVAGAVALAESHRVVVLDVVGIRRRFARGRNDENGKCIVEGTPGENVLVSLAGLEYANVAGLMTGHADVIGEAGRKPRGVDDLRVL